MPNRDCVFCKIIAGELPSSKVYEDDHMVAFLDIAPISPGHTLVVPKAHAATILELDDDAVAKLFQTAKRIAAAVTQAMDAPAFNLSTNNGAEAGQIVQHFHIHVIPRHSKAELPAWLSRRKYEGDEAQTLAARIAQTL